MDSADRSAIRETLVADRDALVEGVEHRWGDVTRVDPLVVEPLPDDTDTFPADVDTFREEFYPYAAGTTVTDDDGRVLCVYSDVRDVWETPGGSGEPGETPAETARRETVEETGINCLVTDALFVRTMEVSFGEPETLPIPVFVFAATPVDGETFDDEALVEHEEVDDVAWFGPGELPDEIREREHVLAHQRTVRDGS